MLAAEAELPIDSWVDEILGKAELHEYRSPSSYAKLRRNASIALDAAGEQDEPRMQ